jgi:hypothetical protein
MQQVQDKLNFPIDACSDEELKRRFKRESIQLSAHREAVLQDANNDDDFRVKPYAPTLPARSRSKRKAQRKAQRKARRLAHA